MLMRKQNLASSTQKIGETADSAKPAFYAGFFMDIGAAATATDASVH